MTLMWCPIHQVYYKLENEEMVKEHNHCEYTHEIDLEQAIANLSDKMKNLRGGSKYIYRETTLS